MRDKRMENMINLFFLIKYNPNPNILWTIVSNIFGIMYSLGKEIGIMFYPNWTKEWVGSILIELNIKLFQRLVELNFN